MKLELWRVLVPVCIGTALSLLGDTALYAVLPTRFEDAGVVLASVGILLSANRWVRLLANNAAGWLADRRPRRTLFVPALFLGVLSTALYAVTTGFWLFLLARLLWGIAWSGIWITGNAIILDITEVHNRGRVVGLYHMSFFIGAGIGSPLGGILTDVVGYRPTMGILASLMLVGALVAWLFLPETRESGGAAEMGREGAVGQGGKGDVGSVQTRVSNAGEMGSAVGLLGVNRLMVAGILLSTFGFFLAEQYGETLTIGSWSLGVATVTGIGLGMSTILSVVAAPVAGTVSDRWGNRWGTAALGLLLGVIGFALLALGRPTLIFVGLPLISFASGSNQGLSTTIAGDLVGGERRGRFLGIFYTVGDLGSAIGPPMAYAVINSGWPSAANYQLAALLSAVMLVTALYFASVRQVAMRRLL
ncbi:MAG: MFS transporter [Anaerolineales bacterium]|nr:MFS transporter [Anaerolineales bacterium]